MTPFSIASLQLPLKYGNNIPELCEHINRTMAVHPWVQMVVLSELAAYGPSHQFAQDTHNDDETIFQELAKKHSIWLCPGSMFVRHGDKIYNQAIVINPDGDIVGRYNKLYPFLPYETGVTPGQDFLIFDIPGVGRFGLSICFDIWYPETTRYLTSHGVEVLIHPVMTGTVDRHIELAIVKATAAMFQCYIIDVNGLGAGGVGQSLVASPTGQIIHQAGQTTEIIPVEIDLDLVRRVRNKGTHGLGQMLKSFRDMPVDYSNYHGNRITPYMESLGPLTMPEKEAR